MANPSTAHEPSMEEILASIRQIISEDGEGAALPDAPAAAPPARADARPTLAEPAKAEAPAPAAAQTGTAVQTPVSQPPAPQPAPVEAQDRSEQPAEPPARPRAEPARAEPSQPAPRYAEPLVREAVASPTPPRPMPAASPNGGALLSAGSDAAVSGAFSALAHTILAQNARTLEDLVSDMLRPMLQGWLDENLPSLVERLVKEEIDRVSRGRR